MIAYKIVNEDFTSLYSRWPWELRYDIGAEVIPKAGKLFIFKSLRAVSRYSSDMSWKGRCLEVEPIGKVIRCPRLIPHLTPEWSDWEGFWQERQAWNRAFGRRASVFEFQAAPPPGTWLCQSLRVIREIERHQ